MIEKWRACLAALSHAGTLDSYQDVAGKIAFNIVHLHSLRQRQIFPCQNGLPAEQWIITIGQFRLKTTTAELATEKTQCSLHVITVGTSRHDLLDARAAFEPTRPARRKISEDSPPRPFGSPTTGDHIECIHIAIVTGENFIAAVTGKANRYVLSRQLTY